MWRLHSLGSPGFQGQAYIMARCGRFLANSNVPHNCEGTGELAAAAPIVAICKDSVRWGFSGQVIPPFANGCIVACSEVAHERRSLTLKLFLDRIVAE